MKFTGKSDARPEKPQESGFDPNPVARGMSGNVSRADIPGALEIPHGNSRGVSRRIGRRAQLPVGRGIRTPKPYFDAVAHSEI